VDKNLNTLFLMYQKYWQDNQFNRALEVSDIMLSEQPDNMNILWYRCAALSQIGQTQQAIKEIEKQQQEEYKWLEDEIDEKTQTKAAINHLASAVATAEEHGALPTFPLGDESIFFLTLKEMPFDICEKILYWVDDNKRMPIINHMISLQPESADLYAQRAQLIFSSASLDLDDNENGEEDEDAIPSMTGVKYSKKLLEKSLSDNFKAIELEPEEHRYLVRAGRTLHLLKRFDEALSTYDKALQLVPEDSYVRSFIIDQRKASENNGQGEYQYMADMLRPALEDMEQQNRSASDDLVYSSMKTVEDALRAGYSMQQAAALISNDPIDILALDIAHKIMDQAAEQRPFHFTKADSATFPDYQQKFIQKTAKELQRLNCKHIVNVEQPLLTRQLGQRILVGIFTTEENEAAFSVAAVKPKWPGILGFIALLLSGQWRTHQVVELSSQFDNKEIIITRKTTAPDHFGYGPKIHIEQLPAKTNLRDMLQHHHEKTRKFLEQFPGMKTIPFNTLQDIEKGTEDELCAKAEYRRSIGYITDDELKLLLGKNYKRFAEKIIEKVRMLAKLKESSQSDTH